MPGLCYLALDVQKLLRFAVYLACRGFCVQATEGDAYADCSLIIPRAALIEDENVAQLSNENVQTPMVLAYCE